MAKCDILIDQHLLEFSARVVILTNLGFFVDQEVLSSIHSFFGFGLVIANHVAVIAQIQHHDRHQILQDIGGLTSEFIAKHNVPASSLFFANQLGIIGQNFGASQNWNAPFVAVNNCPVRFGINLVDT